MADKGKESIDRVLLANVIQEQYGDLEMGEKTARNLELLRKDSTFSLTTGHQLVLFGGPLFTVYKVMTVIKLAEQLSNQYPDNQVVPVFWIHTEDHDFEEINHYFTNYGQKHTYQGAFQTKVGSHILEESIREYWPEGFDAALHAAYQPGRSLADATRRFFHRLFDRFGLLMLDPDDVRLKARFREVVEGEFEKQTAFQAVNQTSDSLTAAGYPAQIHPREINLFYMDAEGRDRLVAENGHYEVNGRDLTFQPAEMQALIQDHPERFSPNVSLRPLYQEMILPNLAYTGGWGELSYWLQLKGVFEYYGVNFPLLLPRFSATVLPVSAKEEWASMGFSPEDLKRPLHQLYKTYMPKLWDDSEFSRMEEAILTQVEALRDHIHGEISDTLSRSADALRQKNLNFLANLRKKAQRVMRHKHPAPFKAIEAFKRTYQPDGQVQERVWSLATISQWQSPDAFLDNLYDHCEPLSLEPAWLWV